MPLTCGKCGSDRVIPPTRVIADHGGATTFILRLTVQEHPSALMMKGAHHAYASVALCGACGHIDFYVGEFEEMYAAYEAALSE